MDEKVKGVAANVIPGIPTVVCSLAVGDKYVGEVECWHRSFMLYHSQMMDDGQINPWTCYVKAYPHGSIPGLPKNYGGWFQLANMKAWLVHKVWFDTLAKYPPRVVGGRQELQQIRVIWVDIDARFHQRIKLPYVPESVQIYHRKTVSSIDPKLKFCGGTICFQGAFGGPVSDFIRDWVDRSLAAKDKRNDRIISDMLGMSCHKKVEVMNIPDSHLAVVSPRHSEEMRKKRLSGAVVSHWQASHYEDFWDMPGEFERDWGFERSMSEYEGTKFGLSMNGVLLPVNGRVV
jgi:hypothetical protein